MKWRWWLLNGSVLLVEEGLYQLQFNFSLISDKTSCSISVPSIFSTRGKICTQPHFTLATCSCEESYWSHRFAAGKWSQGYGVLPALLQGQIANWLLLITFYSWVVPPCRCQEKQRRDEGPIAWVHCCEDHSRFMNLHTLGWVWDLPSKEHDFAQFSGCFFLTTPSRSAAWFPHLLCQKSEKVCENRVVLSYQLRWMHLNLNQMRLVGSI